MHIARSAATYKHHPAGRPVDRRHYVRLSSSAAQKQALLNINLGSIWSIAITADAYLADLVSLIEDGEFDEIFPCAKAFVEHVRAIAVLVTDFEAERNKRGGRQ